MITYLAVAFVLLIIGAIFYGFGIVLRRPPTKEELESSVCFLCGKRFERAILVERVIGDSKVVHFCRICISGLHADALSQPTSSSSA